MEKASGGETVDETALEWVYRRSRNSMLTARSLCRKQWREQPNTIYLGPPQSARIKQPGSREGGTVASGRLWPSTNHGSGQPAADESRGACPIGTPEGGSIVADSIRNLGQTERATVTPHRNPRTNDFT